VVTGRFGTAAVPGVSTFGGKVISDWEGFEEVEPETVLESAGQSDIFVARYDPRGAHVWARRAGGKGEDVGRGIASFPDGSLVVTGHFKDSGDFAQDLSLTAEDSSDVFVARYDGAGALLWARRAGGPGLDEGIAVAALPDGSCVVTGTFQGMAVFGADEARETTLNAFEGTALFVARYDRAGMLVWVRQAEGTASAVATWPDGSCVLTGSADGSAIDPLFLARYDADGALLWEVGDQFEVDEDTPVLWQETGPVYLHYGRTRPLPGQAVAVRPDGSCVVTARTEGDDGSVVVGGATTGTTVLGYAEPRETVHMSKELVARFRPDGSLAWASEGGSGDVEGHAIAAAPDGSVLVTGPLRGYGVVGIGQEHETEWQAVGGYDVYVARFNADGGF
jgi:DNA-binding beta-propeller fold protein YncE